MHTQPYELPTSLMPTQTANRLLELLHGAAAGLGAMYLLNSPTWSTMDLREHKLRGCASRQCRD